ncbi:hypothetical protein [Roseateles sp.]|uniref:hypothetical protein n=1 Tax=Roseateles sp. TaxID=1971397 RepID=UPI00286AD8BE|nr:hypothetical protein [Roseateles sp.]
MAVAIAGLIAVAVLNLSPWFTLAAGALPLVHYHLRYLGPLAKAGLSQAAIDSVYYFGFLITIVALGISAVSVAISGAAANVNTVVYQFGVGLFATGYAVVARMHLASLVSPVDAISSEAIMDRYVKRSLDLVDNVEAAVVRFSEFSQTVMTKTSEVTATASNSAEKSMLDVTRVFENEMKSTLASAREGLTEIKNMAADTSFVSARKELTESIRATLEVSTELNKALAEFATLAKQAAIASQQSINLTRSLDDSLGHAQKNFSQFSDESGPLVKSGLAMSSASTAISGVVEALGTTFSQIKSLGEDVVSTGPAFKSMRTLAKKTSDQLDALAGVSENLDGALERIAGTAAAMGNLADELSRVGAVLPALSLSIETLGTRFTSAGDGTLRLEQQLSGMPDRIHQIQTVGVSIEELGTHMHAALSRVAEGVTAASHSAQTLSNSSSGANKAIDGASLLLDQASDLGATVASLRTHIENFTGSIEAAQKVIGEASTGIHRTISSSSSALETDLKRSSEAATLLVDRLVQVADIVIERTQERQRSST